MPRSSVVRLTEQMVMGVGCKYTLLSNGDFSFITIQLSIAIARYYSCWQSTGNSHSQIKLVAPERPNCCLSD